MLYIIATKVWQHLELTIISLVIATLIAVPLGTLLSITPRRRLAGGVIRIVSAIQAVPSLALISLIVVFLSFLTLPSTGFLPATIVLINTTFQDRNKFGRVLNFIEN